MFIQTLKEHNATNYWLQKQRKSVGENINVHVLSVNMLHKNHNYFEAQYVIR